MWWGIGKFNHAEVIKKKIKKLWGKMYLNITKTLYGKCIPATLDDCA